MGVWHQLQVFIDYKTVELKGLSRDEKHGHWVVGLAKEDYRKTEILITNLVFQDYCNDFFYLPAYLPRRSCPHL